ncbi:MAG: hypothetical protein KI790_16150 [Cyclobacteriaceae bacterium]|nr:hypothetical protein [Cyclobacteriaceae bacterium HetDA_MAG_MS6]
MRVLWASLLATFSLVGQAQIENIQLGPDLLVNKFYAGFNSMVSIPQDSLVTITENSFRVGILATQQLNSFLAVESQAAIQVSNAARTSSIPSFELIGKISDQWQLRAGVLVTPTTTNRPNPITWESQVETYAQSRIIGGRPGATLRYRASDNLFLAYAIHNHDRQWAHHLRMDFRQLRVAGFYQQNRDYFLSMKLSSTLVEAVANYSSALDEVAGSVFVNVTDDYEIYSDVGYRLKDDTSQATTIGVRHTFDNAGWHVKGFFGLAYDFQSELITGQLFVHLF